MSRRVAERHTSPLKTLQDEIGAAMSNKTLRNLQFTGDVAHNNEITFWLV